MNYSGNPYKREDAWILIVDDDVDVAETVHNFLNEEGFGSAICNSGADALKYLKENKVDLILLDLIMPGMNGIEVAQKIRKDEENIGFIPIIMVSAMDSDEDKVAGLGFADDYITKPFSNKELGARIDVQLRISQLRNELLLSKLRYQSLYNNIPEMCISIDKTGNISDCNMTFCNYFNVNKENVFGRSILDFFDSEEHKALVSYFNSLKPGKISDSERIFKMPMFDKNKNSIFISLCAVSLGEHETGLHIILLIKDMTEKIKLEREQRLARQQLYRSARLASIGTLASGTAHEINNPLAAILGFSDALIKRFDAGEEVDKEELKQYLNIIRSETLRCRDVVDNLSKFSRDYEPKSEDISLYDCIYSAVKLMNVRAQKKNIKIKNNVVEDITVNTDSQKIGQVLVNIISNSIDFCGKGSIIKIDVEKEDSGTQPVRIIIGDNGPGISEDILPKIFDPFFTTKEVGKGVGLGLSISYKLMEECGGTIDVRSVKKNGTTVIIEIPRS